MRKRTFDFQDDEIESESYCLSNNSQTQSVHSGRLSDLLSKKNEKNNNKLHSTKSDTSLHSGRLSDLSSKKNEKNNTKLHSTKSNSSDTMKKDSNRRLDHHLYTFRQQQQSVTLANIITIVILLFMIMVTFMLLSIGSKVKSGAILKDETGSSSAFTSHPSISGKYAHEIKRTITASENCDSKLSSLPFLLESRDNVYKSFLIVQPEEVKCYAWISFLTLKISTFWKTCNDPKQLFSNSNLLSPSYTPLARADSVTRKKWIFKAETVSFDIQLLDATRIQGIAMHLEEFQIQYYLRNDLWLQLYGHYHKSDHNIYVHSSGNRNSILLFDEKFTTQNLVKDAGKALMILFLCNNHYNQEQISSLSLKLRAKSTILHQINSIEVLESKTYNKK
jgi:hypothetical protein